MKRILICWMLPVLMLPCTALAEDPVYFTDANLKAAVEAALGKTNPTPTDMLALRELHAEVRGIASLVGLEYAINLWWLRLGNNQISDISPLAAMTHLESLQIRNNEISDIGPLARLTNLTYLWMYGIPTDDISPLAGCSMEE